MQLCSSAFWRVGRRTPAVLVAPRLVQKHGADWARLDGEMSAVLGLPSLTDLTELDTVRSIRGRSRALTAGTRSGRVAVFVDKPTEDVDSFDPSNLGEARRRRLTVGGRHADLEAVMWSGGVVMPDVGRQDALEMATVPDQHPVQA